jgi:hypothetical protein
VKTWRRKSFIATVLTLVAVAATTTLSFTMIVSQGTNRPSLNAKTQSEDRATQDPYETETKEAMTNKRMSQEDIIRLLKEGKEKGYIKGNLPSDPAELQALARTIQTEMRGLDKLIAACDEALKDSLGLSLLSE